MLPGSAYRQRPPLVLNLVFLKRLCNSSGPDYNPSMNNTRRLIVNADDLGRTAGVSAGILRSHREGIVSSTTAMVNLPGTEAAVAQAASEAPELGVGIHLNLTTGRPVLSPTQVSSLVDSEGRFYPIRRLIPRLQTLDFEQIRAETSAQIARFRSFGREPTHQDCHHHLFYLDPELFRILVGLAAQHDIPIRYPWRQGSDADIDMDGLAELRRVPASQLADSITACDIILESSGVRAPDRCVLSFFDEGVSLENLIQVIETLPAGTSELMCHPGLADAELLQGSGYAAQRERELEILTDPLAQAALQEAGVELVSFSAL
jgi:predicted glycoside hydrolase/deacetylase ChbG (UPF0249 family)